MRLYILATQIVAAASSTAFLIKDEGVRCRSGPTTSHAIQRQFAKGNNVAITCQTEGTNIEGNTLWDKTTFGCYVSDYYVATGSSGYVTSKCRSCRPPKSNAATVNLIASFEGFRPNVYNDPTGNPTVGYGHLCDAPGCSEVKYPIPLSVGNGKKLLADDMKEFEVCITAMLNSKANLNRNQYGALISWAFNMGCGNAKLSTLVGRLNNGEDPNMVISQELPHWVYASGQRLPGLSTAEKMLNGQYVRTSFKASRFACQIATHGINILCASIVTIPYTSQVSSPELDGVAVLGVLTDSVAASLGLGLTYHCVQLITPAGASALDTIPFGTLWKMIGHFKSL
ncbi:Lysozyme [Fusarium mundagurra]|uniref:Lysozyme n=1 Tax=Fusarium mundagurra TaxID=1567541 RepID=A0A8H6DGM9_9HYPO|nr:Lysozyme [Fusarium mundagurra]